MAVSVQGILKARQFIYRYLKPTYLNHSPGLSRVLGAEAYLKHENHHPTGAFKIRGGLNLIGHLSEQERKRGVITATRGNHGQSIALASQIFGVKCIIGIPEGNNPEKNDAMRNFGAELLIHGKDFDDARVKVEQVQKERNLRYIHSGNEPMLLNGVGTYTLEILEDLPDPDYVFVPIGGGSGAASILTVVRSMAPRVKVVGVQAEKAPAFFLSYKKGGPVETDSADTIADGLATRGVFELPFSIIKENIDDVITVSEDQIRWGVFQAFHSAHQVVEPAAAASIAGAWKMRNQLKGKKVVMVLTGANITGQLFSEILSEFNEMD